MPLRLKSPAFLIWLALALLLTWLSRDAILNRSGWDPDDQLRLVQLRDFLGGQSWFDTTQYRLNAPYGGPMHWSRLIELPLAAIVLVLTPLLGQAGAEMAAGMLVPLGCFGLIVFMLRGVAAHFGGANAGMVAVIMAMVSPAISMQLRPMRIDHHGWQLVCASVALWTLFWPSARKAGIAMGLALAVWLHISLEGAPAAVVFFALLGWRWAIAGEGGERLGWTVLLFVSASVLLYFLTQGAGLAAQNYCDTISPAHIWAVAAAGAVMVPAAFLLPPHRLIRTAAAGIAGASAIGILLWSAPQCADGAFSTMDPIVRKYWYEAVNEGMPIWHQKATIALSLLGVPATGLAAFAWLYRGSDAAQRRELAVFGVLLIYGVALAMLVVRTISFATLVAVPVVAIAIERLFRAYRQEQRPAKRVGLVALMIVMLMPGAMISQAAGLISPSVRAEAKASAAKAKPANDCESVATVGKLAALPDANIVAPFDIGPAILLTTPHKVLASSHHRNERGMRDHIDIFRLPPAQSRAIVERRGITHIVGCPTEAEMQSYAKHDPTGLWAQLAKGNPPAWLEKMSLKAGGLKVWRVVR